MIGLKELESEGYTILVNNEFGANIEKDGKKYYQDSLFSAMLKRNESKEITLSICVVAFVGWIERWKDITHIHC